MKESGSFHKARGSMKKKPSEAILNKSSMNKPTASETKSSKLEKHLSLLIQIEQFSETMRNQKSSTLSNAKKNDIAHANRGHNSSARKS